MLLHNSSVTFSKSLLVVELYRFVGFNIVVVCYLVTNFVWEECNHCVQLLAFMPASVHISATMTEIYEGRSISSRTVLLMKHRANTEHRNYSQVVPPLMYTTYHGFIYDVMQWRHYYSDVNNGGSCLAGSENNHLEFLGAWWRHLFPLHFFLVYNDKPMFHHK